MEEFLVLTVTTDEFVADSIRVALEAASIPVMLEHTTVLDGNLAIAAYRLLVPVAKRAAALRITKAA